MRYNQINSCWTLQEADLWMSKKYMPRPPYCFGEIPDYSNPPMTVEEYQYYEREFFGFLEEKTICKPVEEGAGLFQRFLQFTGISKVTKYEDRVPNIKFDIHYGTGDNLDCFIKSGTATPPQQSTKRVKTENKATQTGGVATCDQAVQTVRPKRRVLKSVRHFFRQSFNCFKTED
ncbi:hypothetical protein LOTGIDRAFT_158871 [Lottia gigantea]|uniref:Uncharacterized protein n=1 Tax=Lottia gigantea TaxID=225164 RepID=V4CAS2_LOTGI|nr:hypothetical protein LOTGIDRAFT_158871 [Lottia gigantea]ESO98914.1 hypothetical protein LOTGIDRAFT_158871 [Lottia gigantea]